MRWSIWFSGRWSVRFLGCGSVGFLSLRSVDFILRWSVVVRCWGVSVGWLLIFLGWWWRVSWCGGGWFIVVDRIRRSVVWHYWTILFLRFNIVVVLFIMILWRRSVWWIRFVLRFFRSVAVRTWSVASRSSSDWRSVALEPVVLNRFRRNDVLNAASICWNPDTRYSDSRVSGWWSLDDGSLLLTIVIIWVATLGEDVGHVKPSVRLSWWTISVGWTRSVRYSLIKVLT